MPTTIEVTHYKFSNTHVYCGYAIDGKVKPRTFTVNKEKVDCIKCLQLLNKNLTENLINRRGRRAAIRRHLIRADREGMAWCGIPVKSTIGTEKLKLCKVCFRNCKAKGSL